VASFNVGMNTLDSFTAGCCVTSL